MPKNIETEAERAGFYLYYDPDRPPEPITPGMPLVDPNGVWVVEQVDGWYVADGIVHGTGAGAEFARWLTERREHWRRQDREYAKAQQRKQVA